MPKGKKIDNDNPEWTSADSAKAVRFDDLPPSLKATLAGRRRGERGVQRSPTKQSISIRLSPDVLTALRATGRGWQATVDSVLRERFVDGNGEPAAKTH